MKALPDWLACPDHLRGDRIAQDAWEFYAAKFYARGWLEPLDTSMLGILCSTYSLYRRALIESKTDEREQARAVLSGIAREEWEIFREYLAAFDLDLQGDKTRPIELPPEPPLLQHPH
jgi:phage terminase small subunit